MMINRPKRPSLQNGDFDAKGVKPRGFPEGTIFLFHERQDKKFLNGEFTQCKLSTNYKFDAGHAVLNGKVYSTGGKSGDDKILNAVECYSPYHKKINFVSPMNFSRASHGCCSHVGQLFVCGGKNGMASTCCEKLNLSEGVWKFVAKMNLARKCFRLIPCDVFIWAIGGEGSDGKTLSSTEFYDEVADIWTLATSMNEKRQDYGAVGFRNKIFVIGGMNEENEVLSSAEVFDIETYQFTFIRPMNGPRWLFAAAINGYKLYCFNGMKDLLTEEYTVISYNLYTEKWKEEEKLNGINCNDAVTVY